MYYATSFVLKQITPLLHLMNTRANGAPHALVHVTCELRIDSIGDHGSSACQGLAQRTEQAYPRDVRTPDRLDRRPRFQAVR